MSVRGCVHLWFLSEAWRVATAQRLGWAPSSTERQLVAREDEVSIESYGGQRFRIFLGGISTSGLILIIATCRIRPRASIDLQSARMSCFTAKKLDVDRGRSDNHGYDEATKNN